MSETIFWCRPVCFIIAQILSRWILTKAFLKSTKLTKRCALQSMHCSTMFLTAKFLAEKPLPALNPIPTILTRLRITRQNTLLGIDSKVLHLNCHRHKYLLYFHYQSLVSPPIFLYFFSFPHFSEKGRTDTNICL